MIDARQVSAFATKLDQAAVEIDGRAENWADEWGTVVAAEMAANAPRLTGELADSIAQIHPGVVEVGVDYGVFVERGTAHMAPQPFAAPALDHVRPRALDDAGQMAVDVIRR